MQIEYPKWIYHKTLEAKIVQNKEEQLDAGPEWKETPAAFIDDNPSEEEYVDEKSEQVKAPKKSKGAK